MLPTQDTHLPGSRRLPPPLPPRFDARAQQQRIEAIFRKRPSHRRLGLAALALVWLMAAAYYFLLPPTYFSKWSMILPSSNSSSSMTLDSIGQASTTPSQPFGTIQLSPKVIYREIATSDQVRDMAADILKIPTARLGRARVRLIDETSMMLFQINGRTPEEAQAHGRALIEALAIQLDQLRRDEQERRAKIVRDNLKFYQSNLDAGREKILEFQRETGLLSLNQFNEASSSAELMRRKLAENRSEIERVSSEQSRLVARLGLEPSAAAAGLRLAADPAYARLSTAFAESAVAVHENSRLFGPNHPARVLARAKGESAYAELLRIARQAQIDPSIDLRSLVLMMNSSHQSELLRMIVSNEASLNGRRTEVKSIERELARVEVEIGRMGAHAARLEALRKDHLVAEAVLTSAMARLDTNRADLYSSYPLVQVMAEPDLPKTRSQPRLSYALGAGLLGTLIILLAWGAAWIGTSFSRKRPRKS